MRLAAASKILVAVARPGQLLRSRNTRDTLSDGLSRVPPRSDGIGRPKRAPRTMRVARDQAPESDLARGRRDLMGFIWAHPVCICHFGCGSSSRCWWKWRTVSNVNIEKFCWVTGSLVAGCVCRTLKVRTLPLLRLQSSLCFCRCASQLPRLYLPIRPPQSLLESRSEHTTIEHVRLQPSHRQCIPPRPHLSTEMSL